MGKNKNSARGAEQQALQNQSAINQQLSKYANQLAGTNSQYYQPMLPQLAQGFSGIAQATAPGVQSGLQTLLGSQGNMQGLTGIDPNHIAQLLQQYASQPGATNVSQATPGLQSFYQGQMQNGINPQFAQNAQNQLSQQSAQAMSDARAHAMPGQNMNALALANQDSLLQNSTNLAGSLAGQSQNFANQGAQGLGTTAGNFDTQKLGLLQAGQTGAQGLNTQAIANYLSALQQGQSSLNNANAFMNQGTSNLTGAMDAMAGIAKQNADQASQFGAQAQQQQGSGGLLGGLLGLGGSLMTGGAAGVGGLGSILGKL